MPQIAGVTVSSCFKPLELRPADAFHCGAVEPMTCQWHGRCCVGIEHSWVKNRLCFRVLLKPLSLFGTSKPDKKSDLNLFFFRRQAILCNQYVYIYIYIFGVHFCLFIALFGPFNSCTLTPVLRATGVWLWSLPPHFQGKPSPRGFFSAPRFPSFSLQTWMRHRVGDAGHQYHSRLHKLPCFNLYICQANFSEEVEQAARVLSGKWKAGKGKTPKIQNSWREIIAICGSPLFVKGWRCLLHRGRDGCLDRSTGANCAVDENSLKGKGAFISIFESCVALGSVEHHHSLSGYPVDSWCRTCFWGGW